MLGLSDSTLYVDQKTGRILPAVGPLGVKVVSIEFALPSDDTAVIWRAPLVNQALRDFIAQVEWGQLDVLVVDLPPGTGDAPLTIAQSLQGGLDGSIIVTIPTEISRRIVVKAVDFSRKLNIRVAGVVENMGVDRAILASDRVFAGADTWATAHVLAKTIEKYVPDYDLVVAGEETIDSTTAHIGAQTASWLGVPYVYYVYDAEVKGRTLIVRRFLEDEGVDEVYEVEMPAVISVLKGSQVPRETRLSRKLIAREHIQIISNNDLKLEPECVGLRGSPTVVAGLAPATYPPRKRVVIQGEPQEIVKKLVEILRQEGVI